MEESLKSVKTRINRNYNCIKELEQLISEENGDDENLEIISFVGKMYAEYVSGIYSSFELEKKIIEIGEKITFSPEEKAQDKEILIVMSECGTVGGHTVLVHNWIKWDNENKYSIVFTDMDNVNVPEFLKQVVKESGGKITYLYGSYMKKALKLLEISQRFQRILLFTHMEDIIPVLAYSNRCWKIPVYFYNHSDFRFSYGYSVSDVVLNLCEFDMDKTIRFRGINSQRSVYLQFPGHGRFEEKSKILDKKLIRKIVQEKYGIKEKTKLVVSMGDDFKYENIIGYEFDTYVKEVLKQVGIESSFLIIGADKEKEKWICLKKETNEKARALGILSRSEAIQLISAADLYIVSFPMIASGRTDAEQAKVPSLLLNIYGRGIGKKDDRVCNSVKELIDKTLEVLQGNSNKYLSGDYTDVWTKKEWRTRWKEICNDIVNHELHSFYPNRLIEKQEYVNCQLMQKKAAEKICFYIESHHLDEKIKNRLWDLDQKYDMGIKRKYITCLEKRQQDLESLSDNYLQLSDKHLQLYLTSIKWIKLKQKRKSVGEYLYKKGYRTVAIYGMSYMGKSLVDELADGFVKVLYGIDRNADYLISSIAIHKPSDLFEPVDIIINTTMISNSSILEGMNVSKKRMISFNELLDELDEI